jgi:hypothetical protein
VRSGGSGEQEESSNSRAALSGDLARVLESFKEPGYSGNEVTLNCTTLFCSLSIEF